MHVSTQTTSSTGEGREEEERSERCVCAEMETAEGGRGHVTFHSKSWRLDRESVSGGHGVQEGHMATLTAALFADSRHMQKGALFGHFFI